jgi:putative membrane protein
MKMALVLGVALLTAAGASAQAIDDAQIAAIVVAANQVDIDAGKVAEARASSADVKAFGAQMVAAHTGVNKSAVELVTRLKVTPKDNATSQSLKQGGAASLAQLKTLKGTAFDHAYVDHEVAYHQQVLDAIDKTLIPGASNSELKALLVKVRPAIAAHLEHAKMLQAGLAAR